MFRHLQRAPEKSSETYAKRLRRCNRLLKDLKTCNSSVIFLNPIDPIHFRLPRCGHINRQIDLSKISKKIKKAYYRSLD